MANKIVRINRVNTVVIVGGAAGANIAAEILSQKYKKILFLETYSKKVDKKNIIRTKISEGLSFLRERKVDYFIATGDNYQRKENFELLYRSTGKFPINCIDSSVFISKSAKIGYGNLICPQAVLHTGANVGNCTIINTSSVVDHDSVVEDFSQVSPNVTLCGYVKIGRLAFIGAGSVLIPKISVGEGSIIAAGSSVIKNVKENVLVAGVPAVFKKNLK